MPEHARSKPAAAKRSAASGTASSSPADRAVDPGRSAPAPTFDIYTLSVHPPSAKPQPVQRVEAPNRTGLPDRLKSGMEALSGFSMDDVRVHRNSAEPAKLGALAYARGTTIHLAPGQDHHLAHEAWHVVQQKQGRVRPTLQVRDGLNVNDQAGLEREADAMGARAANVAPPTPAPGSVQPSSPCGPPVTQRFAELDDYEQAQPLAEPPELTPENDIDGMEPEAMVTLARGVSPSQRKYLSNEAIAGSYVGHQKMLPPEHPVPVPAEAPARSAAEHYVNEGRENDTQNLIEFSSDAAVATAFSQEGRHSHTYYVGIARKHLTKGSGGEKGWIAYQAAPYSVVHAVAHDRIEGVSRRMAAKDLREAASQEADADMMVAYQRDRAAFLQSVPAEQKPATLKRILSVVKRYGEEQTADSDRLKTRTSSSIGSSAGSAEKRDAEG